MMWGPDYDDGGWAMMFGSLVVSMIFVAAVVIGVVWLVRAHPNGSRVAEGGGSAQDILGARYARGEIDEAEFTRARQLLAGQPPRPDPRK